MLYIAIIIARYATSTSISPTDAGQEMAENRARRKKKSATDIVVTKDDGIA